MPGFDGTGPRGLGPFTGRGEGYCAVVLSDSGRRAQSLGYTGILGTPLRARPLARPFLWWAWPPRLPAWRRSRSLGVVRGRRGGAWRGRRRGVRW